MIFWGERWGDLTESFFKARYWGGNIVDKVEGRIKYIFMKEQQVLTVYFLLRSVTVG